MFFIAPFKMEKKTMIIVGVIVVALIVIIFAFSGGSDGDSSIKTSDSGSRSGSASGSVSSDKQNYAKLEADLACLLANAKSLEDLAAVAEQTDDLMKKHGYTAEEVSVNKEKYTGDEEFKELVLAEVQKMCPGALG